MFSPTSILMADKSTQPTASGGLQSSVSPKPTAELTPSPQKTAEASTPPATSSDDTTLTGSTLPDDLLTVAQSRQLEDDRQSKETVSEYFERHGYSKIDEPASAGDAAILHVFVCVMQFKDKRETRGYQIRTKSDLLAATSYLENDDSAGKLVGFFEVTETLAKKVGTADTFNVTDASR